MRKTMLIGGICLAVGLALGILLGRFWLEREWSQPSVLERLSAADAQRSTGKDADPAPAAGSLVLRNAPVALARRALSELTRQDPVVMIVGDVGNTDRGHELHLDLKNRGKCQVTAFSGTAYGYDAYGTPRPINKGGEYYVAFSEENVSDLGPNQTHSLAMLLHHADIASLAIAQVDRVTCSDGTKWARN